MRQSELKVRANKQFLLVDNDAQRIGGRFLNHSTVFLLKNIQWFRILLIRGKLFSRYFLLTLGLFLILSFTLIDKLCLKVLLYQETVYTGISSRIQGIYRVSFAYNVETKAQDGCLVQTFN